MPTPIITPDRKSFTRSASATIVSACSARATRSAFRVPIVAGTEFGTDFTGVQEARKVVFARNTSPRLAYEVVFTGTKRDQTPTEMHYFVDASSGKILDRWDMVHTAKPGGGGMLLGMKVTERVAGMRTLPIGVDQRSACRHPDWTGPDDLAIKIAELREITDWEKPIYVKIGASRPYYDVKLAVKAGAAPFAHKGADGKYLPEVLLDLDYWALVPR